MNWIKRIEINSLWGTKNLTWELNKQVSILAGGNGTGKSTMLRSLASLITTGVVDDDHMTLFDELIVTFSDNTAVSTSIGCDPSKLAHRLHANFLDNELVCGLTTNETFCDKIDDFIGVTGKNIIRDSDCIKFRFVNSGHEIAYSRLSSGEKVLVNIMAMAALSKSGDVIILDEPEVSLHFDWQKELIGSVLEVSGGDVQLIVSTHSPAIVMGGWMSNISQIENLGVSRG